MLKRNPMAWAVTGGVLAALVYFGWKFTARSAYESAEYTVIEADGACEIRQYPDIMLARTSTDPDFQGDDGSFMRLFGFISGGNEQEQKIAMTVPVFMERDSKTSVASMGFVVPKEVSEDGIPRPTHEKVKIHTRTGGRFAVIRFAGRLNKATATQQEKTLRNWMNDRGFVGDENAETAGYDPPWTPGPFRRNEVLIRLAGDGVARR